MKTCTRIIALLLCLLLLAGQALAVGPNVPVQTPLEAESETETRTEATSVEAEMPADAALPEIETLAEETSVEPEAPDAPAEDAEEAFRAEQPEAVPTADADQPPKPFTEMTDAEIIEWFSLKTKWSQQALIFAVRNGLMVGVSAHDLAPKSNTTQAELATIMMCILKTQKKADLSGYTGVKRNA